MNCHRWTHATALFVAAACLSLPARISAQNSRNSAGKIYVASVSGEVFIRFGEKIEEVTKGSVYNAEGATIQTPAANKRSESGVTIVFSNGTSAALESDTRVAIRRFKQEPFRPNRSDAQVEPSVSQLQVYVAQGTVSVSTSKLVAGSSMMFATAQGSINIRGGQIVIEVNGDTTRISQLRGDSSTVRGGANDLGGHLLHVGERIVIAVGVSQSLSDMQIVPIPPTEVAQLTTKVGLADVAKRTVYFEMRPPGAEQPGMPAVSVTASKTAAEKEAAAAEQSGGASAGAGGTAFDAASTSGAAGAATSAAQQIVALPLVPVTLPTEFTISPARLH